MNEETSIIAGVDRGVGTALRAPRGRATGASVAAFAANDRAILILCVLVGLIPIWSVDWFPSVDGPIHMYIVHLMDKLASGDAGPFARIFRRSYVVDPNLTVYGVIWAASRFLPMLTAEKLFVSVYWMIFAGSSWYLMRAFGNGKGVFGLLLLPFATGEFLHWGFYNFVLSQALFLFGCGYFFRRIERLGTRHIAPLAVITTLLALTHLVGVLMFLMVVGFARTGMALRDRLRRARSRSGAEIFRSYLADALRLAVAALPAIVIVVSFFMRRVVTDPHTSPEAGAFDKVVHMALIAPILSIDKREAFVLAPFVLLFWAVLLRVAIPLFRDRERLVASLPTTVPPAALAIFVLIGSFGFSGFDAYPRLLPFFFFLVVIAFASWTPTTPWRAAIGAVVLIATVGTATLHFAFYRQINALYARFEASRPPPPAGSIVVAVNLAMEGSSIAGHSVGWRMDVTKHFREAYARRRDLPMLNIELLAPQMFGYFPVVYRRDVVVGASLQSAPFKNYRQPLATFERDTGLRIAEVSFWPHPDPEMPLRWLNRPKGAPPYNWMPPEREEELRAELRARWRPIGFSDPLAPLTFTHRSASPDASRDMAAPSIPDTRSAP
ncbi:hypothetical protein [uncultured Sphingomonas sp.]|uniref:hypothetical protein n=1 Tax=uncultured Sphingomonas sp. TaxID=158754 RepID=UPI0035CAA5B9